MEQGYSETRLLHYVYIQSKLTLPHSPMRRFQEMYLHVQTIICLQVLLLRFAGRDANVCQFTEVGHFFLSLKSHLIQL